MPVSHMHPPRRDAVSDGTNGNPLVEFDRRGVDITVVVQSSTQVNVRALCTRGTVAAASRADAHLNAVASTIDV